MSPPDNRPKTGGKRETQNAGKKKTQPLYTYCPHCRKRVKYHARHRGSIVGCPYCSTRFPIASERSEEKTVEVYYLKNNRLHGPIDQNELRDLSQSKAVKDDTPVWISPYSSWIACGSLLDFPEGTLAALSDPHQSVTPTINIHPKNSELPSPRSLLALRFATEQEYITKAQATRFLRQLLEANDVSAEVPQTLSTKGWITAAQKEILESVMDRGAIPRMIGGYEILEELGTGGMGTTYRARQVNMDRIIALKVLSPMLSQDPEYVARFEREARMAARLNHPNIATAFEIGSVGDRHFISMEYIEGPTLGDMIDGEGAFVEKRAVEIVLQMCRALVHAQEHSLVHRDVTPSNIIIQPNGQAKLIDVGLAKSTHPEPADNITVGFAIGTPAYASPEQVLGRDDLDIRSDIYSLGCVFYEMLAGDQPLRGSNPQETFTMHVDTPVPSVKDRVPSVSHTIAVVISKMTAINPDDRYQSPLEIIEILSAHLRHLRSPTDTAAPIPPIAEQLRLWEKGKPVELRIPHDKREYVHVVARKLDDYLSSENADPEFRGYVHTMYTELTANAFDHGCREVSEGSVDVVMELNDAFFSIEVKDPGPGFAAREMLEKIKKEPLDRERRRGIMQVVTIADSITYSTRGNDVKAILYRKGEGSGIVTRTAGDIMYVEIKGKGDLTLSETFARWTNEFDPEKYKRICLVVHTEWVSSTFVGDVVKLSERLKQSGRALSVYVEHHSCFRIIQQLGLTRLVHVSEALREAETALRYAEVKDGDTPAPPTRDGEHDSGESEAYDENEEEDDEEKRPKQKKRFRWFRKD